MCGIAGIFAYASEASPVVGEQLLRVRDRMYSRGPDGEGLWIADDRRIGLAHRRLAIIDLSGAGAQPMLDPETGNRIVFNGEIYNYKALRAELQAAGYRFRSHSDTEVLLKLYDAYGQDMLQKLRGMFAFALWDEARKGLFLARDPFGIKPLYVADDGKTLRFASQVRALLADNAVDTTPEPAGHVGFFVWGHVPEPYTLYKGIRAVPAGASLWVDRALNKVQRQFFRLSDELTQPPTRQESIPAQEVQAQLRAALLDTVSHHLVADVPVGLFLSAGLDSAALGALATEVMSCSRAGDKAVVGENTGLRTLTLGFTEYANTENDEVPLAETVARHLGARHTTRRVCREDFESRMDHLLEVMDQPSIDGVNAYFVSLAAREAGLKVALSGLGGDELFAGYPLFRNIPRIVGLLGPLARLPGVGRGFRYVAAPLLKQRTSPKYAGLLEYGGDYASAYLLHRGLFMPWELPQVLDGEMVREGWRDLQTLPALRQTIGGMNNPRLKLSALEASWYMRNQLLRDNDWASMAHSLEVRVPLVDVELFRATARLVHSGQAAPSKKDMARSTVTPLPDAVLNRGKTGFSVPVREWLLAARSSQTPAQRGYRSWAAVIHRQFLSA